jgi:hypothetical protein
MQFNPKGLAMSLLTLTPTVALMVDELGNIEREINRLKSQAEHIKTLLKEEGAGRYEGASFASLVYYVKGSTKTDWKAIAEHVGYSRQLFTAHTTTGAGSLSCKTTIKG